MIRELMLFKGLFILRFGKWGKINILSLRINQLYIIAFYNKLFGKQISLTVLYVPKKVVWSFQRI
jgi:hypothetical protein